MNKSTTNLHNRRHRRTTMTIILISIAGVFIILSFASQLAPSSSSNDARQTQRRLQGSIFLDPKTVELKSYTSIDNNMYIPPNDINNDYLITYATCADNSFLPKNWCHDTDNNARYVGDLLPPHNIIKHYNHNGYEKCLAEKNVVFIGDSRVRYQFMHLAAYLKYERFMKCRDVTINPAEADEECFVIDERMKQRNWTLWFEESTKALESYQQSSLCDCYRPPKFDPKRTYENRFIKRSTRLGKQI
ncbi:hypothetical protein ACHAWC_006769 [Mediolabrus comicus]